MQLTLNLLVIVALTLASNSMYTIKLYCILNSRTLSNGVRHFYVTNLLMQLALPFQWRINSVWVKVPLFITL